MIAGAFEGHVHTKWTMHDVLWSHKRKVNLKKRLPSTHQSGSDGWRHIYYCFKLFTAERRWNGGIEVEIGWHVKESRLKFPSKMFSVSCDRAKRTIKRMIDRRFWSTPSCSETCAFSLFPNLIFLDPKASSIVRAHVLRLHWISINQLQQTNSSVWLHLRNSKLLFQLLLNETENCFQCQFNDNFCALNWAMHIFVLPIVDSCDESEGSWISSRRNSSQHTSSRNPSLSIRYPQIFVSSSAF